MERLSREATEKGEIEQRAKSKWNRAKRTESNEDKNLFREIQKDYKNEIELAKVEGWRGECSSMVDLTDTARLCRILQNPRAALMNSIRLENGWAKCAVEALGGLLHAHFPDFRA